MRTSFRTVNGVTILKLRGKITIDHRSQELRESVRRLLSDGTRKILLDLGGVNYVDSTGVGAHYCFLRQRSHGSRRIETPESDSQGSPSPLYYTITGGPGGV